MKKYYIVINNIDDIKELVQLSSQVNGDVIISKGKFSVDGKSLMGVISLDISNGATVVCPAEAVDLNHFLMQFSVL